MVTPPPGLPEFCWMSAPANLPVNSFVEGCGACRFQLANGQGGNGISQLFFAGCNGKAGDDDFVELQDIYGELKRDFRKAAVLANGLSGGFIAHKTRFDGGFRFWF